MALVLRSADIGRSQDRQTGRIDESSQGEGRARGAALVVLLSVVLGGLAVGLHDLGMLGGSRDGAHQIGENVHASFGVVAVEFVRSVDGVTNRALAGASHGVSGLVDSSHSQIQVAVAVTNRSAHPIQQSANRFTLLVTRAGKTTAQKPQAGDLPDMRILPNAGIEGHLDFTIPRQKVHLTLLFKDPGRRDPIVIDLGTRQATAVSPEHSH
ncbi:MAG: hypothetical protein QOI54_82 [Actinomycetota bacterium]|jgi:hypothetical protein|nr:hypothetical protein [Actinomycetota bacterium]